MLIEKEAMVISEMTIKKHRAMASINKKWKLKALNTSDNKI
jgi:hypothetical protein